MPEMNYNTQYQDLINKLIQSKPKPTIDPLTLALLTFGDKVNQTTSMPQTNRLGSGLNEAFKTFGEETNKQNTSMRLWDAQNVDFLRAVLTDETAKAKAKAEAEQRILDNQFKTNEDLRKQRDEERKIAEGIAFGKMVTEIPKTGQLPVRVISEKFKPYMGGLSGEEVTNVSSDLQKQIFEAVKPKEPTKAVVNVVVNPKSTTGFSYQDFNTGKMGGDAPKPKTDSEFSYGDKELVKKTLMELPKLKKEALVGENIETQIDTALELVKKGVTGKGGQVKSWLAPYAEMLGYKGETLNDDQTFQLLTRAIIGPLRLEIVGPGPVSEWEQKLMQQISGGGGASKQAAVQLLTHWKKLARSKIDNYNDTLTGLSDIYPDVGKVYKQIQPKSKSSQSQAKDLSEISTEDLKRMLNE